MSEHATEPEAVELPHAGDAAFASLMDTIAPENDDGTPASKPAEVGAPAVPAVPAAGGGDATAGQPAAAGAADAGAASVPTAGDPVPGRPGDGETSGAGAADAGADPAAAGSTEQPAAAGGGATAGQPDLTVDFGQLSTALEEKTTQAYQQQALAAVREEHPKYFEALEKHPRLLVGLEVPAIGREGTERLKDANDAREWQEAVKSVLVEEVQDRVSRSLEDSAGIMQTLHASIELFQNNADLVPNTTAFDQELADRFATMAAPYELRADGKLQGYTIPVQPLIDSIRDQLTSERAARTAATKETESPAAPASPAAAGTSSTPAAADAPQAGIQSKAGNSGELEDFSTLFGTIGLPNLQI